MQDNNIFDEIIIGAGPAGLTAAYELLQSGKENVLILEKNDKVGGLASTKVFGEYSYDIGPHRFFTKNEEINELFLKMLGKDAVKVNRLTRIYYKKKYFNYPLTPVNALFGLGPLNAISIISSYIYSRIKFYFKVSEINNFEDWVIDKFGRKLYSTFFKNYTEKVWGIDCSLIGKDWAAQRIKGLSLSSAIKNAFFPNNKNKPKSLIDSFYYPKHGAGMLWEKFEDYVVSKNIPTLKDSEVVKITEINNLVELTVKDINNNYKNYKCKKLFFSNPLLQFVNIYENEGNVPQKVIEAASSLEYRHHISVHIGIDTKLFDDNWIYIHSPDIKAARIADFTNFSEEMAPRDSFTITLEYFCFEHDELWGLKKNDLINLGIDELEKIFNKKFKVVHSEVTRNKNAYPVINSGYEKHIEIIKDWLVEKENISAIGRSGMFKYNNQDHAMATAIAAVRQYLGDDNYNPWEVNIDGEYHEMISQ